MDLSENKIEENNETKTKRKNKKVPIKGENVETSIDVSIEDAFYGVSKKISLRTIEGKMKTFDVKIPAGIRDNEKIRLLYVGITRAKEMLMLSGYSYKDGNSNKKQQQKEKQKPYKPYFLTDY